MIQLSKLIAPSFYNLHRDVAVGQQAEHLKAVKEQAYRHEYLGEVIGTGGEVFANLRLEAISDEHIAIWSGRCCPSVSYCHWGRQHRDMCSYRYGTLQANGTTFYTLRTATIKQTGIYWIAYDLTEWYGDMYQSANSRVRLALNGTEVPGSLVGIVSGNRHVQAVMDVYMTAGSTLQVQGATQSTYGGAKLSNSLFLIMFSAPSIQAALSGIAALS